jgi:hypothetical protein
VSVKAISGTVSLEVVRSYPETLQNQNQPVGPLTDP